MMHYFGDQKLSEAGEALVHFDRDSIRQVVAAGRRREPEIWLVDPELYERNGRVLRDSPGSRLLAYSSSDRILYATDGCNSCTRDLKAPLGLFSPPDLASFADANSIRLDLLQHLLTLIQP